MAKIRILLIEDNRLLREGTTALLNEQKDIRAVSSPGNRSALAKAKELKPNVVLLDLGPKSHSSLKVLEAIRKELPRAEVVVMDLLPSHFDAVQSVKAGVSGFVPRDATVDDFLNTIRSVVTGEKVLPTTMADSVLSQIVEQAITGETTDRVIDAVKFTKKEQEVIKHLAEGQTISETSITLKIAVHTTKGHVRSVLEKLALRTRLELAASAQAKRPIKNTRAPVGDNRN